MGRAVRAACRRADATGGCAISLDRGAGVAKTEDGAEKVDSPKEIPGGPFGRAGFVCRHTVVRRDKADQYL